MATYAVDSKRQAMEATGIVNVAPVWETVDGKRRPMKDSQARHEDTGMPLWEVEVQYVVDVFGRQATATANVQVGALDRPTPKPHSSITFTALSVDAILRRGSLVEYWSAEEIADYTPLGDDAKAATSTARQAASKDKAA